MPCEFECARPGRPGLFFMLGSGCQFGKNEKLFVLDEKRYCRFHLPMKGKEDRPSEKAGWDEKKIKAFAQQIFKHMEKGKKENPGADLTGVVFPGDVRFSNFRKNNPLPTICFYGATFSGNADFSKAAFSGSAFFSKSAFSGYANFSEAAFSDVAYFSGSPGEDALPSNTFHFINFNNCEFKEIAAFSNRRFLLKAIFKDVIFHAAPVFHNAELHQDTNFTVAKFLDTSSEHAARAYRTLKLAMGNVRARKEEADFYAYEQESLMNSDDTPTSVKVASWFYKYASDYGRSFMRPFWLIFFVTAVFWMIYVVLAANYTPSGYGEAALFALDQVVRPFKALTIGYGGAAPAFLNEHPIIVRVIASLQSLATLGLVTLFILAVRRRFRLN